MSEQDSKKDTETKAPETVTQSTDTETKSPETTTLDPEAAKREGVKEQAVNSDAMAVDKTKAAPEKAARPSFFVKKTDRHRVEVDVLSSMDDGRIRSVSRVGLGIDFAKDFPFMRHDVAWFEFSVPTYEDMSTYRQRSSAWRREAQQSVVDRIQLRNFMLVWHLKDWSLTDDDGNKVKLEHEDSGALTDESMAKVYAVNPTLIDVVLTLFEKDILLT